MLLIINRCVVGGDIPPKKLQALQKVLQSEFCNAIREVHVQECLSRLNNISINLLAFYQKYCSLIGYATHYLTIRLVSLAGYGSIAHEAKLNGPLTCGP